MGLTSSLLLLFYKPTGCNISFQLLADHGPQRMFKRQIQPYFSAHETKQMGPFKIDMVTHSYGQEVTHSLPDVDTQKYKHIFHDRFNLDHHRCLERVMKSYLKDSIKDTESMRILCFMECRCQRLLYQLQLEAFSAMGASNR